MASRYFERQLLVGNYSSRERILFVGEGDFAFSSGLATAFGRAPNICATSIDRYDTFYAIYGVEGVARVDNLRARGAQVYFGVDITTALEPYNSNTFRALAKKFDRIVFNYPHSGYPNNRRSIFPGFYNSSHHEELIRSFFNVSRTLLRYGGEVHVTHKVTVYKRWKFNQWAKFCGLYLKKSVLFIPESFKGYVPCRGAGKNWRTTFPLGKGSRTYIYGIGWST